jgi:hypothetical protein
MVGGREESIFCSGIGIAAYCVGLGVDLVDSKCEFESAVGISSRGTILVRPGDFAAVAWRKRRQLSSHQAKLEQAMRQALCLQ